MPDFHLLAATASETLQNVSTLNPVSPPAESIRYLFLFITAVALGILCIVWGVLFYSLIRFRRKKSADAGAQKEPPQVYGSMPIEIAWTVAPTLIVFVLALVIVRTEFEVRVKPSQPSETNPAVRVSVVGHQWWWEYSIEQFGEQKIGVTTANELHLPVSGNGIGSQESGVAAQESKDRPIYLTLQSADVCHSFWLPRLAGKTDLIPGRVNETWFQTSEPGWYLGQCAEYCGAQHANMLLRVYFDKPDDFAAWLANEQKPAVEDLSASAREGKQAFLAQSCVKCHTIRGTAAKGTFGPDLTHLASRDTLARACSN